MSFLQGITDLGKSVLESAPGIIREVKGSNSTGQAANASANNVATPTGGTGSTALPPWLVPVGVIVGLGVLVVVLIKAIKK